MRCFMVVAFIVGLIPLGSKAQVLELAELSVRDIERLDRDRTVVILPGGILEEHGPYLPSFTDGYLNAWLAQRTAEAILAERGGTVLMFPMIPLGAGPPEGLGGVAPLSGSYMVRPETLRAVYMDLASALGEDGFRTVFVFSRHGAPSHNWALIEAAEYFNDRFDGDMVVLTSLIYSGAALEPQPWSAEESAENGIGGHADANETSQTLFLKPRLVHEDYRTAVPFAADSGAALSRLAEAPGWLGYFGSPRIANASAGAAFVAYRTEQVIELALRILDGFDWRSLPRRRADRRSLQPPFRTMDANNRARAEAERRRQEEWIAARDSAGP